jgi:hypothetical protein
MQFSRLCRRLRLPPSWTLVAAVTIGGVFAVWRAVSGAPAAGPAFVRALIWPGTGLAGAVYLFAWLGWALDID